MHILIICGIILMLLLGIIYIVYKLAFYNDQQEDIYHIPNTPQYRRQKEKMLQMIKKMDDIPYEPVTILSHDGLELFGRYYSVAEDAPLQIQFHGYRGSALRDLCGGHELARQMGHNTLVVDQRSHGKSEGKAITFGIKERLDCVAWANYAAQRFGKDRPIFLVGVSMGASTVIMASALNIPENVVGVMADCPFSSPRSIIEKVCNDMHLPGKLAYPFVALAARIFGRFDLGAASARDAIKQAKVPVLIIHGEDDKLVPCQMSVTMQNENAETVTILTVPQAGHGLSYLVDSDIYARAVRIFVEKSLSDQSID